MHTFFYYHYLNTCPTHIPTFKTLTHTMLHGMHFNKMDTVHPLIIFVRLIFITVSKQIQKASLNL